jgi:hypothetical protein
MAHRVRKVRMARTERDRKVRTVDKARKARTRDKLFVPRAGPSTFGHRGARSEANLATLEICRSPPSCFHLAPHPLVRDNNRGERAPSEPWRPCAGGVLHQDPVYTTVLLPHKTVLHRDSRSSLRRNALYSLGAAVRFPASPRSVPALPLEAPHKSGLEAALSVEPAPKASAAGSLGEDGESATRAPAEALLAVPRSAVSVCCLGW